MLTCVPGEYEKAAHLAPKVFSQTAKLWETWIFRFAQQQHLQVRRYLSLHVLIAQQPLAPRPLYPMFLLIPRGLAD